MKKRILVSVVLAAFMVEVGFGVYVAFERKYESALNSLNLPIDSVKPIPADTDRELEVASLSAGEDFFADTQVDDTVKRLRARPVNTNNVGKKLITPSIAAQRQTKSINRIDPNKLVAVNKTTETRELPTTSLSAQKEPQRSEDKSLVTKTLSALKKPFGWIKSIGSKLR